MKQRFNRAVGVPFSRIVFLAGALVILPGLSLIAWNDVADAAAEVPSAAGSGRTPGRATASTRAADQTSAFAPARWNEARLGGLDPKVFELALGAAKCAVRSGAVADPRTLTVIDYSMPSTVERLWVYDVRNRVLLYKELVAHGQGSGVNYATEFSNQPDTHRTSIGLFVTEDTYVGRNGYSLRLNGLDQGFNDRARERAIVIHGAPYVNASLARAQGRIGRSWGCPALNDGVARRVIDTVKGGSLVFSYYPDQNWLGSSRYLGDCAAAN